MLTGLIKKFHLFDLSNGDAGASSASDLSLNTNDNVTNFFDQYTHSQPQPTDPSTPFTGTGAFWPNNSDNFPGNQAYHTGPSGSTTTSGLISPPSTPPSGFTVTTDAAGVLVSYTGSNLEFQLNWDSSVTKASSLIQSNFKYAWETAAEFLEKNFSTQATSETNAQTHATTTGPIVINVNVGYGEVAGSSSPFLFGGALGASSTEGDYLSFGTLSGALQSVYSASGNAQIHGISLPSTDPTGHGPNEFFVPYAEEKALGLPFGSSGYQTAVDGWVGMAKYSSTGGFGSFNFDYTTDANLAGSQGNTNLTSSKISLPSSSSYDAIGVAAHELTEVMGRISALGTSLQTYLGNGTTRAPTNQYTALDLFRYNNGHSTLTSGTGDYFSVDGGATHLGTYNSSTGDKADWASNYYDSMGFGHAGYYMPVSSTGVLEMATLGYTLSSAGVTDLTSHPPAMA
jgi:hypothetical protein